MAAGLFAEIQSSPIAQAVAKSNHLVGAALQIVHIAGLLLLLASVVLVGLRAYGLGLARQTPADIARGTARLFWTGLVLAAGSGALIFASSAVRYADNGAFDLKIGLLVLAVAAQVALLHRLRTGPAEPPVATRLVAGVAVLLWFGVAGSGRAIGYI